jgi:hypothetical protein
LGTRVARRRKFLGARFGDLLAEAKAITGAKDDE